MSNLPENNPRGDNKGTPRRRIVGMYDRPERMTISPLLITGLAIILLLLAALVLFMFLH